VLPDVFINQAMTKVVYFNSKSDQICVLLTLSALTPFFIFEYVMSLPNHFYKVQIQMFLLKAVINNIKQVYYTLHLLKKNGIASKVNHTPYKLFNTVVLNPV
jgi:hypothetical protein